MMARPAYPTDVSREEFELVREQLETARKKTRPRKHDLYDVFCAVLYFLDSGSAWRHLPREFPPWRTVHEYFTQWTMRRSDEPSLLAQTLEKVGRHETLARLRKLLSEREAPPATDTAAATEKGTGAA